jgi:hypothetical protein
MVLSNNKRATGSTTLPAPARGRRTRAMAKKTAKKRAEKRSTASPTKPAPALKRWRCYGAVTGSKYLGEVEAQTAEEATEKAFKLSEAHVSLCHQCAGECEDATIEEITVEEDT